MCIRMRSDESLIQSLFQCLRKSAALNLQKTGNRLVEVELNSSIQICFCVRVWFFFFFSINVTNSHGGAVSGKQLLFQMLLNPQM